MIDKDQVVQNNDDTHTDVEVGRLKRTGRLVGLCIVLVTIVVVLLVAYRMTVNPRTEDASVGAHYIGMAPEVEGRINVLHATDGVRRILK